MEPFITMSSKNQRSRSSYKSPLEWLDEKTKRYSPKIVSENNRYKDLFEKGKFDLFEKPSSSYRYYHIHAETTIDIIDDLTDYANETTTYTLKKKGFLRNLKRFFTSIHSRNLFWFRENCGFLRKPLLKNRKKSSVEIVSQKTDIMNSKKRFRSEGFATNFSHVTCKKVP